MNAHNPDASPGTEAAPASGASEHPFRDLSGLTRVVSVLLIIGIAMQCVGIVSSAMQLSLLSGPYSEAEAYANDLREERVGTAAIVLFVVTVVVFARWIYLAHRNLPALGAENLRYRPGWAVGVFFSRSPICGCRPRR